MKISLRNGSLMVECINDPNKKKCDNCMKCKDPQCNRSHCDAHGMCNCIDTECRCLGR
jgi:hypothetical protein